MIDMQRAQLKFSDHWVAEEVDDLREHWTKRARRSRSSIAPSAGCLPATKAARQPVRTGIRWRQFSFLRFSSTFDVIFASSSAMHPRRDGTLLGTPRTLPDHTLMVDAR